MGRDEATLGRKERAEDKAVKRSEPSHLGEGEVPPLSCSKARS